LVQFIFISLLSAQSPQIRAASQESVINGPKSTDTGNQSSVNLLEQLASEQIQRDSEFLGKTRFRLDQQDKTFFYDLAPAPGKFLLAKGDPYEPPLEALIRTEALRRDFRLVVPNDNFWVAPLESIERVIKACVRDLDALMAEGQETPAQELCSARIQTQFDKLQESILSFASGRNFTFLKPAQNRDPAPGYRVQIKIDPPRARIRVMPLLEYKKNQYLKLPQDQYQWNDLLDSESELIGWYHYRAEWPPDLNGPEEGNFCIRKPGLIIFKPPQR
jgi:hypothetical protein